MTHSALNTGNYAFLPEMRQGRINQDDKRLTRKNVFVSINPRPAQRKIINTIMINFIFPHLDRRLPINGVSGVFSSIVFSSLQLHILPVITLTWQIMCLTQIYRGPVIEPADRLQASRPPISSSCRCVMLRLSWGECHPQFLSQNLLTPS